MPGPWRTTTHLPYPFTMGEFEACPEAEPAGVATARQAQALRELERRSHRERTV